MADLLKLSSEAVATLRRLDHDPLPIDVAAACDWARRHGFSFDEHKADAMRRKYEAASALAISKPAEAAKRERREHLHRPFSDPCCPHCGTAIQPSEGAQYVSLALDLVYFQDVVDDELVRARARRKSREVNWYVFVVTGICAALNEWHHQSEVVKSLSARDAQVCLKFRYNYYTDLRFWFIARASLRGNSVQQTIDYDRLYQLGCTYTEMFPTP